MSDSRRDFFSYLFGSALAAGMAQQAIAQQTGSAGLPTRKLGRTNEQVSILCLGGWHIGAVAEQRRGRPHYARGHRRRDDVLRYLLGLPDGRLGGDHRPRAVGRRQARQGLPDD
jgi:hypothetical protein